MDNPQSTWTVMVSYTDRARNHDNTFVTYSRPVTVLADSPDHAKLVAAQLAGSILGEGMVTGTEVVWDA